MLVIVDLSTAWTVIECANPVCITLDCIITVAPYLMDRWVLCLLSLPDVLNRLINKLFAWFFLPRYSSIALYLTRYFDRQ